MVAPRAPAADGTRTFSLVALHALVYPLTMSTALVVPSEPRHVVAIIGGAVAGSEAAALCAERGILAIVLEQNDRPFGKIEDGLPRWHEKLREKEYAQIGENLGRE